MKGDPGNPAPRLGAAVGDRDLEGLRGREAAGVGDRHGDFGGAAGQRRNDDRLVDRRDGDYDGVRGGGRVGEEVVIRVGEVGRQVQREGRARLDGGRGDLAARLRAAVGDRDREGLRGREAAGIGGRDIDGRTAVVHRRNDDDLLVHRDGGHAGVGRRRRIGQCLAVRLAEELGHVDRRRCPDRNRGRQDGPFLHRWPVRDGDRKARVPLQALRIGGGNRDRADAGLDGRHRDDLRRDRSRRHRSVGGGDRVGERVLLVRILEAGGCRGRLAHRERVAGQGAAGVRGFGALARPQRQGQRERQCGQERGKGGGRCEAGILHGDLLGGPKCKV